MAVAKQKQAQEKRHPPGTSKILNKARKKAEKKGEKQKEAWGTDPPVPPSGQGEGQPLPVHPERPHTRQWEKTSIPEVDPTPRPDRISQDYAQEYPSIEVESRKLTKTTDKHNTIEQVKLEEGQEAGDSEDEWQLCCDQTDPENADPDDVMAFLGDQHFIAKLKTKLESTSSQVLAGGLEGASQLRVLLKVISNIITIKCDADLLTTFLSSTGIPDQQIYLIQKIVDSANVKQQPWCQQILLDLVITIHAFIASELGQTEHPSKKGEQLYCDSCMQFFGLIPKLLSQKLDCDLRLREQTLMCVIFLCESLERSKSGIPDKLLAGLANDHTLTVETFLHATQEDTVAIEQLQVCEGNMEAAASRMQDIMSLGVATLTALTHQPIEPINCTKGKQMVAKALAGVLIMQENEDLTNNYLRLVMFPDMTCNVIKVLYATSQESTGICSFLACSARHMTMILAVLEGKLPIADMELNTMVEMTIHLLCVIVLQLQDIPPDIADSVPLLIQIFLDSQIASHTAAAALLFSQLLFSGVAVEIQVEDILEAAVSIFTDLAQICCKCPLEYGVLDGVLLLLCQLSMQSEVPIARMYIECGLWNAIWHRSAQALNVHQHDPKLSIQDLEGDGEAAMKPPDWDLLSPQGLMAMLHLSVIVFTKETFQCVPQLANADGIVNLTVMHLLSNEFLHLLATSSNLTKPGSEFASDIIEQVTQILCFPFAIDLQEDMLMEIYECFYCKQVVVHLLFSLIKFVALEQCPVPIGLLARLVMGETVFVEQFAEAVQITNGTDFLAQCVSAAGPLSVKCDTLSVFSHMARSSPNYVGLITRVFQGLTGEFAPLVQCLKHDNAIVRSRVCVMLGNLMRHSDQLYTVLVELKRLCDAIRECLQDEDPNVRKGASYAIGNAVYHSGDLYRIFTQGIPPLVKLLRDPFAKTRSNAASALGNLCIHNGDMVDALLTSKAHQGLLDVVCHDSQYSVQETAISALRSQCQHAKIRQELCKLRAIDKLSSIIETGGTPRSRSGNIVAASSKHTGTTLIQQSNKLINILSGNK
ncbi:unnamed protein product [Owenia fusiformis]|uniref:non-specific serine/threonine protein kinase n=1 Tax=Owenia fusiformis TaxID=6347 RepID=A0A8J1TKN1_OWEFU|nr:unnamed protein product [Owenia fusiformis]